MLKEILLNLPEVAGPKEKKLGFKEKLKWTCIVLLLFFIMGSIPLFGLGENVLSTFEMLSVILGAKFGSIISLGIGPLVTASIVLQLLNGSGLVKFDLTTTDGKKMFQGVQKVLSIFFIIFEAFVFVLMGGLSPQAGISPLLIIFQLMLGGILIMFMDEVVSKWGFGSGISLFIAAGVSEELVVRLISPFTSAGTLYTVAGQASQAPAGALLAILYFLPQGDVQAVLLSIAAIASTLFVFAIAVYAQSMKVEIPLSFGRIRGHGIRWPLSFIYTSNIPVILVAALMANINLWARLLETSGHPLLGTFVGNTPASGLVLWITPHNVIGELLRGSLQLSQLKYSLGYVLFMVVGCIIFSIFWVQTSGMDARSQAERMMSSGLQIPGFRRDQRVLEQILNRYIMPLTVMGAVAVGVLAALADLSGALTSGTGLLLTVMIVYRLYEDIAHQHAMDMSPMLRRFIQ